MRFPQQYKKYDLLNNRRTIIGYVDIDMSGLIKEIYFYNGIKPIDLTNYFIDYGCLGLSCPGFFNLEELQEEDDSETVY